MVSTRLSRGIPAGMEASNLFPWWTTGMVLLGPGGGVPPTGRRFAFAPGGLIPGQRREPWLRNDQPGPVHVTEVRFWSNQPFYPRELLNYKGDFLDGLVVQMETDLLQGLIKEWMPVKALHTEEDVLFFGQEWAGVFKLPAPFFVQAQEQFGVRIRIRDDLTAFDTWVLNEQIQISLRGKDPLQGVPTAYNRVARLPAGRGLSLDYYFDDDRDAPIRDNLITDVAFSNSTMEPDPNWQALDGLEVKFLPPTGPEWTKDPFTHLNQGLFEQVGMAVLAPPPAEGGFFRRPVIHRPKRPYILRPGDSFRIEGMFEGGNLPDTAYDLSGENIIFCRISGVQEGTNA